MIGEIKKTILGYHAGNLSPTEALVKIASLIDQSDDQGRSTIKWAELMKDGWQPCGEIHADIDLADHVYLSLNCDGDWEDRTYSWSLMSPDHVHRMREQEDEDVKLGDAYTGCEIDPTTAQILLQAKLAGVLNVSPVITSEGVMKARRGQD